MHQCVSEHPDFADEQVCEFVNLVAWNNTLLVVTPTPPPSLPRILIAWEKTYEGDEVLRLEHTTPQALASAMRSALGVGPESSEAAPELELVSRAGLFHQQHAVNFYHLFSEILPTIHALLCSRWPDTCGERPAPDLRLFWVNWKSPARPESLRFHSPPAVRDALACLSSSETLNVAEATLGPQGAQSLVSDSGRGPAHKGLVFRQALVGLPRASRIYHQKRPEWKARFSDPPEAELMRSYRRRMAACLGVPFADARAPLDPIRVTLVNRPYEAGRSLLNAHTVAQRIREHAVALGIEDVEVNVLYLEGSLREQARAVAASSLYIWCHGAAMAHAFFLPAGARAVELVQWPVKDPADQHVWVRGIKKAFRLDVGLNVVVNDDQRYNFFNQEVSAGKEEKDAASMSTRSRPPPRCSVWDFMPSMKSEH